jgi:cell division protein FtsQ
MKLFNWSNIRLILMFSLVVFLFSFTSNRNNHRKLSNSVVVFVGNDPLFVDRETVNKLLIENKPNAKSIGKDKLDLNRLEKELNSHEMIEKSEVFVSIDGVLKAVVKQKTPIARYFDGDQSFYIDYKGNTMPLSTNFTARVPLVSGEINKKNSGELAELFRIIYDDAFLKKNIIGVQIMPNGSLKMVNRNYNFEIDFGGMSRMNAKFNNYKAFFQKAVLDSSLYKYNRIDLRFAQQVVCTK